MNNAAKLHAECNMLVSMIADNGLFRTLNSVYVSGVGVGFAITPERNNFALGKVMIRGISGVQLSREDIYEQVRKLIAPYYL